MPYPFKKRNTDSTKPYLADNLYAGERTPPPLPWRPANSDDRSLEEIRAARAKLEEQKPSTIEEDSNAVADEFNMLSSLILPPDKDEDNFSLNLFNTVSQTAGQQAAFSQSKTQATVDNSNVIEIDLGKQKQDERVKKVIDDFGKVDLTEAGAKTTGDDLLDMMDEFSD